MSNCLAPMEEDNDFLTSSCKAEELGSGPSKEKQHLGLGQHKPWTLTAVGNGHQLSLGTGSHSH